MGGATGLIGDPCFKSTERQLNSTDVVENWVESLKKQVSHVIDFDCGENSEVVAINLDWTKGDDVLDCLLDGGKQC